MSEQDEEIHQQDRGASNRIGNIRRGGKIIINMGKRSKPPSKGIFMSLRFLIKISWRLKNKAALCELQGSFWPSTLNSYSGVASLKRSSCFKQAAHEIEA